MNDETFEMKYYMLVFILSCVLTKENTLLSLITSSTPTLCKSDLCYFTNGRAILISKVDLCPADKGLTATSVKELASKKLGIYSEPVT